MSTRFTSPYWITAVALAVALVPCGATAFADEVKQPAESLEAGATTSENSNLPWALKGDTEIERLTNDYEAAQKKVDEAAARVAELQSQIDEVMKVLPAQQERSDAGMRQRYIMQSNPLVILDSLIESETLDDFLKQVDYLERISNANLREYNRLRDLKAKLTSAQEEQKRVQEEAQSVASEAESALRAEQDKRAAKQASAVGASRGQAASEGGEASVGKAADGGEQPEDFRMAATTDTSGLNDGANWYASRDDFIAEWAPRLDAYLAGSALAGQGVNFAASAWKHCIDPRWSAAISNTESSKGAICIRPHNAWGWGAADSDPYGLASEWGSWEEAIDAHAKGLADGYGYTISLRGAKAYCPNTWQSWYNKTLGEMSRI